MLSDCGIACCVVMGGAAFYLTTRLGIGSLDFRGKVCSLIVGKIAVLYWLAGWLSGWQCKYTAIQLSKNYTTNLTLKNNLAK